MIHGHGGNTFELARRLGCAVSDIVDMSSNVNPLGPPPGLMDALLKNAHALLRLPEAGAESAVAAWARRCGLPPSRVVPGNGSTELIHLLPRALDIRRALIVGPTYADYADACRMAGTEVVFWTASARSGFAPDLDAIARSIGGADAVFLCNPNNPTGAMISAEALGDLCRTHGETLFVIDESYLPFAGDPSEIGIGNQELANVVVLSSMSKIFRLPGLRIGFATGADPLMARCRRLTLPWSQNALAQAAVVYLVDHQAEMDEFVQASRDYLDRQKAVLVEVIREIPALDVFPGRTAFILCRTPPERKAADLWEALSRQRMLIRDCANFHGLDERYFRISLKRASDNRRLSDALRRFFDPEAN